MQIDVIGGSGFIGSRLVKRLIRNESGSIRIIDKVVSKSFPQVTHQADVRSIDALQAAIRPQSVVINLAAEHRDDVQPLSLYEEVNVGGAFNICQVCRNKGIRQIIFTSSVAVYGFAPLGTGEFGEIAPFNDYGRTKHEAEQVFKAWQEERPDERSLVIIRPTVVFGEQNRGNVFNLLKQIASGRFVMIGKGLNRKSMAYVENVAAFVEHGMSLGPGTHVFNYIDKPDFTMSVLVSKVNAMLGRGEQIRVRIPYVMGYCIGKAFDAMAMLTGKRFAISAIRVKKFCADSVYETSVESTGFVRPVPFEKALEDTVRYEFIELNKSAEIFYSE